METNNNNSFQVQDDNEMAIEWDVLLKKLLKHKFYIAAVTFVSAVLGCAVALMQERIYTVNVTLAPEVPGSSAGGSLKSFASLLGMGGMSMGSSGDALNITLFPEICSSTSFLSELFDVEVTPYVSPKELKAGKPETPVRLYDFILGNHKPKSAFALWKESLFKKEDDEDVLEEKTSASYFNKEQTRVMKALQKSINATVDKKTGVTSVQVVMNDPRVAQEIADTVCQRLQDFVTSYRTEKTNQDYLYYQKLAEEAEKTMIDAQLKYAASVDYDRSVILQSVNSEKQRLQQEAMLAQEIYSQMKQQESLAKAKIQEMKPVFAVIQPAVRPLLPSNSRKNIVLAFMFIGFCASAGWKLFGQEKFQELKAMLKEEK